MSVRVVARIRPQLSTELAKDTIVSATSSSDDDSKMSVVRIPNPKNAGEDFSFQFHSVYDQEATQQEIFEKEVAPTIKHLFNGFDVTLFAYGVTGTGKTHTMRGGKTLAERGVIPRLLSGIYRRARKLEKDSQGETKVEVNMSYYEIYNDKVFDLFESPEKRTASGLQLREAGGGKTVVVGLTERPCESLKEFEKLYDHANLNRSTSATKLNAHSSRSHAILCVKLSIFIGEEVRSSTACAIDLAGSEDNRRTENGKERLVESASINKSLFVLAQCVEAISKKQQRIPYRESKMTRILSLGQNNGLTIMILNLAPVRSYHLDTLSSLNFANRTKKIEVREVENEPVFKGCPRAVPTFGGPTIQRQPLRPLATTVHNVAINVSKDSSKQGNKPPKAFSVYSDKSKSRPSNPSSLPKRSSPLKRPSDQFSSNTARPSKHFRSSPPSDRAPHPSISKETLEDIIEKKVTDILAARALDQSSIVAVPEISEEVQRRLELLEKKIEGKESDGREQGLTFLLMAKQHHVRGEDSSALKMYELAKQYFPDNVKLESKIKKLQEKVREKKEVGLHRAPLDMASATTILSEEHEPSSYTKYESNLHTSKGEKVNHANSKTSDDDEYKTAPEPITDTEYDSTDSFRYRSRPRKPPSAKAKAGAKVKSSGAISVFRDHSPVNAQPQTPRTRQLLDIINTRDISQIRALKGVGAKKADIIVEALCVGEDGDELDDGCGRVVIEDLGQLGRLKGVGVRAVESMRVGLGI